MTAGRILLLVFGMILLVGGVILLFAGGGLIWLDRARMDSDGFLDLGYIDLERDSYAVVAGPIVIDAETLDVLEWMGVATTFKVEGRSNDPVKGIFIGVAERSYVRAYLGDVEYDWVSQITNFLSIQRVRYMRHAGDSVPTAPGSLGIWAESAQGTGDRTLEWRTDAGSHSIVLMNDDGSAGIDLSGSVRVKIPDVIVEVAVAVFAAGAVLLAAGAVMVYFAVRGSRRTGTSEQI